MLHKQNTVRRYNNQDVIGLHTWSLFKYDNTQKHMPYVNIVMSYLTAHYHLNIILKQQHNYTRLNSSSKYVDTL